MTIRRWDAIMLQSKLRRTWYLRPVDMYVSHPQTTNLVKTLTTTMRNYNGFQNPKSIIFLNLAGSPTDLCPGNCYYKDHPPPLISLHLCIALQTMPSSETDIIIPSSSSWIRIVIHFRSTSIAAKHCVVQRMPSLSWFAPSGSKLSHRPSTLTSESENRKQKTKNNSNSNSNQANNQRHFWIEEEPTMSVLVHDSVHLSDMVSSDRGCHP